MRPLILLVALAAAASFARADSTYTIAVVPKGTTHEYWKAVHAGALKAAAELNAAGTPVNVIWKGPLKEDDRDAQIQVIENFIGREVNAIVLAPLDERALAAPIEESVAAHIPVVVIDSAVKTDKSSSFIATDNLQGGRLAARRLGQLLGGKGNVILIRYMVGSASTEAREAGFLEVMKKEFPGIRLISTDQHAGATRDTAKTVSDNLLNRFGASVNGVFAPNESAATGMLLAMRDAGLAGGKVKLVGFDTGQATVAALKSGDIQGLVLQNPFNMGYLGVKAAVGAIRGEKLEPKVDTGVEIATPDNMNDPAIAALLHPQLAD